MARQEGQTRLEYDNPTPRARGLLLVGMLLNRTGKGLKSIYVGKFPPPLVRLSSLSSSNISSFQA